MAGPLLITVIGAGPVGLAVAAHLVSRGLSRLMFERGPSAGAPLEASGHVPAKDAGEKDCGCGTAA